MSVNAKINIKETMVAALLIAPIALVGNWVGYKVPIVQAVPGMLILMAYVLIGLALAKVIPVYVPTIAYIATLALVTTLPGFPYAAEILGYVKKVNFLALATPIIAFASISLGKDLDDFNKAGWKLVLAALIAMFSVYITSAIIAEVILRIQGFPR